MKAEIKARIFSGDYNANLKGEIGLDGIAILLNGHLVITLEEVQEYYEKNSNVEATIVFIQAKRGDRFNGGEISTFFRGIKHFFEPKDIRPGTNEKIEILISIKDYIFSQTINQGSKPFLETYFACCGSWNEDNNLINCVNTEREHFVKMAGISRAYFGLVACKDVIELLKDDNGGLFNLF